MRPGSLPIATSIGLIAIVATSIGTRAADPLASPSSEADRRLVIVDTDLGQDDLMALAWLLREPSLDILAITVSGTGLSHCDPGVDNLRAVVAFMGTARPEVGCGPEAAIGSGTAFPDDWRAFADALGGVTLPAAAEAGTPSKPATEIITGVLRAQTGPVTILTLGPFTNLATALTADASLAAEISEIVAMGGALDVPGNVIPEGASTLGASEWNLHADPVAAATVLRSGVPVTYVALDATNDAPMTAEIAASLSTEHDAPGAWLANELIAHDPYLLSGEWFLWDPLAAGSLIDPTLVTFSEERLSVGTTGADAGRLMRDEAGNPARVATTADGVRFTKAFLAGLRAAS